MIEKQFDIPFVAELALREKQIQQNYRPVIGIHKWFARRPGTLFRSLLLAEFDRNKLQDCYYEPHMLTGTRVADPFMGGGTPILEANRIGCDVVGIDVNPMAYWIVRQAITHLDLGSYREAASNLRNELSQEIGELYKTTCLYCESATANVKYFLWIKTQACQRCGSENDLFPGYLLAKSGRHPNNVIICPKCGALNESPDRRNPGSCKDCRTALILKGPANRNRSICQHCDELNVYPRPEAGPPKHRMFAIEYNCSYCVPNHKGRFFKKPDQSDLAKYDRATAAWSDLKTPFVPDDAIPNGDETDRLHRWGYRYYREMFNERQLLGLELSCQIISKMTDPSLKNALATNLSDLLRYQNMLCRYDTMALKSLDIFSIHGYPVGLVQCESNLLGITSDRVAGGNIGSGGWSNMIEKFTKAKSYCELPFEVRHRAGKKTKQSIQGEWIGETRVHNGHLENRVVELCCGDAGQIDLPEASLDAVLTDPPYYGNVQYAELIDFCYVWLRRLIGDAEPAFEAPTTRNAAELTGNVNMERGINHFTEGLSSVFCRMARALKPGSPLVFTYHHNKLDAYYPIVVAILDAGLTCSATLPCPAEMTGSIHISGTGSSVVDTVFVCRSTGTTRRSWVVETPQEIADLVRDDAHLLAGSLSVTRGDTRCIIFGHLARLAVWNLRSNWNTTLAVEERLSLVADQIQQIGGLATVEHLVKCGLPDLAERRGQVRDDRSIYTVTGDEISF